LYPPICECDNYIIARGCNNCQESRSNSLRLFILLPLSTKSHIYDYIPKMPLKPLYERLRGIFFCRPLLLYYQDKERAPLAALAARPLWGLALPRFAWARRLALALAHVGARLRPRLRRLASLAFPIGAHLRRLPCCARRILNSAPLRAPFGGLARVSSSAELDELAARPLITRR